MLNYDLFLNLLQKSGEGGNVGSIMSIIGKNCLWVIVFSDTMYILCIYCLKIHNSLMFYLLTMYIIMFSCCNVKKSKLSAKLNSEDNINLKNKTASVV